MVIKQRERNGRSQEEFGTVTEVPKFVWSWRRFFPWDFGDFGDCPPNCTTLWWTRDGAEIEQPNNPGAIANRHAGRSSAVRYDAFGSSAGGARCVLPSLQEIPCASIRKKSAGDPICSLARFATCGVKCFLLCVSNQSGRTRIADNSTGTSA